MNKFQKVSFRSLADFMDYLPEEELIVVETIRQVIFECIPDCTEKLKFNVPYYARHSNICFLWPAAIPWGAVESGVSFGFTKGHLITSGFDYLYSNGRKAIASRTFNSIKEIDFDLLRIMIDEAVTIDKDMNKSK